MVGLDRSNSAKRFIRKLHGGSQPILVEAADGLQYVVKFMNNLQGPNVLFNESMGTELYKACNLSVPDWRPLWVTKSFLKENRNCWIEDEKGLICPSSGWCFAVRYLGGPDVILHEILNSSNFKRVQNWESFWLAWLIDICASHSDHRQAIFCESKERILYPFFIDHGHLFGGPKGEQKPRVLVSKYLDPRIYWGVDLAYLAEMPLWLSSLNFDQLRIQMKSLPAGWVTTSSIRNFNQCLERLANKQFLRDIVKAIQGAEQCISWSQQYEHCDYEQSSHVRAVPILSSQLQSAARS